MELNIDWRGISPQGQKTLGKEVRTSLRDYFKYCDGSDGYSIRIVAFSPERGGNAQQLLKVVGPRKEFENYGDMVPVSIHTSGTQGLIALLAIAGLSREQVQHVLENGPYTRPKRNEVPADVPTGGDDGAVALPEEVATSVADTPQVVVPDEVSLPHGENPVVVVSPPVLPRLTPREKLERVGLNEEELGRLRATLATILTREIRVQRQTGELGEEDPNTLRVPVTRITEAILEHMKLPRNASGNYRGTIANFYVTRIALFALKSGERYVETDVYDDWLFDCALTLDFVGGKDQLAHLTREREVEVAARIREEAKPKADPVPAAQVVAAVTGGRLPDESIFELAMRSLEGRRAAEEEVLRAQANVNALGCIVADLEAKLAQARQDMSDAEAKLRAAIAQREQFVIPAEILEKVRAAKARLDQLAKDLGL
jgi:hypothetical protein